MTITQFIRANAKLEGDIEDLLETVKTRLDSGEPPVIWESECYRGNLPYYQMANFIAEDDGIRLVYEETPELGDLDDEEIGFHPSGRSIDLITKATKVTGWQWEETKAYRSLLADVVREMAALLK